METDTICIRYHNRTWTLYKYVPVSVSHTGPLLAIALKVSMCVPIEDIVHGIHKLLSRIYATCKHIVHTKRHTVLISKCLNIKTSY